MRIRPYREDDVAALADAASTSWPEIEPWMPWCHRAYGLEDARSWISRQVAAFANRTEFDFAILDDDVAFAGACGLNQIDTLNRRANVGYWMRTSAGGRGYATAAVRSLVRWAFANTDLQRLEIVIATANAASIRVAEKAGATFEAVLRQRILLHGLFHDALMYSFVRGDRG